MFLKLLYIVNVSSNKTIIKLHRLCLGVNKGAGKTALSPTFSCNGNNPYFYDKLFLKVRQTQQMLYENVQKM